VALPRPGQQLQQVLHLIALRGRVGHPLRTGILRRSIPCLRH
jgi:hypothetical protein